MSSGHIYNPYNSDDDTHKFYIITKKTSISKNKDKIKKLGDFVNIFKNLYRE